MFYYKVLINNKINFIITSELFHQNGTLLVHVAGCMLCLVLIIWAAFSATTTITELGGELTGVGRMLASTILSFRTPFTLNNKKVFSIF